MNYFLSALVALTLMLFAVPSHGKIDLSVSTGVRSYPLSGALKLDMGKSLMLWGTRHKKGEKPNPLYGYARAGFNLSTAGTHNRGLAKLEFYPLSFLGFTVGGEIIKNSKDYSGYNCSLNRCLGRFSSSFGDVSLTLGYQDFFLLSKYRLTSISAKKNDMATFIEPKQGLRARSQGDRYFQIKNILGFKLSKEWILAYNNQYAKMKKVKGTSKTNTLNVIYKYDKWSFAIGGGIFESSVRSESFTTNLLVKKTFSSSLALF